MSLNLEQKQAVVAEVAKAVAGAQAIVMVENRGLPVADMTQLRAKARASALESFAVFLPSKMTSPPVGR